MKFPNLLAYSAALTLLWIISACAEAPDYPDEPVITYEGISSTEIYQFPTGIRDSILIFFSFTDGDGDLTGLDSNLSDIIITDSRSDLFVTRLSFPDIDQDGTGNGISGDATIVIDNAAFTLCCLRDDELCIVDSDFPADQFTYKIQVRDRAGNFSNIIETEPITMLCLPD
ncbi:MAG: hypothetical protein AAFO91_00860 [Bacteroidota bacterium]